jgi:transcriptional regulator with XRE-family HTH domain
MPETIGQQLKTAREARNLTFRKINQATHIQARLLEAMEADDFESLPSPVQGRAFLRLYAEFLELSLDDMIARQRLSAGQPDPAFISTGAVPGQDSLEGEVLTEPGEAESVSEPRNDNLSLIQKKIKGLFLRLRKTSHRPNETANPVEPIRPEQPTDPEPTNAIQTDPIEPPAEEPGPASALRAGLIEPSAEEPGQDWQEEPLPPAGLPSDLEPRESQRIFTGIGQALRQRRESLSLTLDEIERHTHVRAHYLQALELGDFDHLPSSVQTRGMLNNYAHFLDMDVDTILLQFAEGLQIKRLERQPLPVEKQQNANVKHSSWINFDPARFRNLGYQPGG